MTTFRPGDRVHMWQNAWLASTTGTVTTETLTTAHVRWDDNHTTTPHHPQHLEPAGEPMTTEQHFTGKDGIDLEIVTMNGGHFGIDVHHFGAQIPDELAPAVALAILEAAGIQAIPFDELADTEPGHAVWALRHHVQASEAKAKEAADREALEAEAWVLFAACNPDTRASGFGDGGVSQRLWTGIARAARELYGVKA